MQLSSRCLAACLWTAGLLPLPASAQSTSPIPAALPPLLGAAAVVDRAHAAQTLGELNPLLTGESAAFMGLSLTLTVQTLNDLPFTYAPKSGPPSAQIKSLRHRASALLPPPWLTLHAFRTLNDAGTLPPSDIDHGHQLLTSAVNLSNAFEKTHSPNKFGTLNTQFGRNVFPASSACDFQLLSSTRIKIVPRSSPALPFEAHLEGGQWHLDVRNRWPKKAPHAQAA